MNQERSAGGEARLAHVEMFATELSKRATTLSHGSERRSDERMKKVAWPLFVCTTTKLERTRYATPRPRTVYDSQAALCTYVRLARFKELVQA